MLLLVAVESNIVIEFVCDIRSTSRLGLYRTERLILLPAMDETTKLPSVFCICALDRVR